MRETPRLFELVSPTHLTCLAAIVAGVVEIKLCPALVLAVVGVTRCGGMFCSAARAELSDGVWVGGVLLSCSREIPPGVCFACGLVRVASMCRANALTCCFTCCPPCELDSLLDIFPVMYIGLVCMQNTG